MSAQLLLLCGRTESVPRGVRSLTFFLSKSPELMDDNWGKRLIKRSVCVPFPTPGAPTRMIRAARESAIETVFLTTPDNAR